MSLSRSHSQGGRVGRRWGAEMCLAADADATNDILGRACMDLGFDSVSAVRMEADSGLAWHWTRMHGEALAPDGDFTAAKLRTLEPLDGRTISWLRSHPRTLLQSDLLDRQPGVFHEYMHAPRDFGLAPWATIVSFPPLDSGSTVRVGFASTTRLELHQDRLDDARFLAQLYCNLSTAGAAGQNDNAVELSERQVACLRWTAAGKSYRDIGDIMGLSERTVRYHLEVARQQYGFSTIMQTVVQAAIQYDFDALGGR